MEERKTIRTYAIQKQCPKCGETFEIRQILGSYTEEERKARSSEFSDKIKKVVYCPYCGCDMVDLSRKKRREQIEAQRMNEGAK